METLTDSELSSILIQNRRQQTEEIRRLTEENRQQAEEIRRLTEENRRLTEENRQQAEEIRRQYEEIGELTEEDEFRYVSEQEFKEADIRWSKIVKCKFALGDINLHEFERTHENRYENYNRTLYSLLKKMMDHNIITTAYFNEDRTFNVVDFEKNWDGFEWIEELGVSIQGKESRVILNQILNLVTQKGVKCDILIKLGEKGNIANGESIRFTKN